MEVTFAYPNRIHVTGIFTYIGLIFMVNVGENTIHGSYGIELDCLGLRETTSSTPKCVTHGQTHSSSVRFYNSTLLPRHCKCIASSVRGFRLRSKIPRQRYSRLGYVRLLWIQKNLLPPAVSIWDMLEIPNCQPKINLPTTYKREFTVLFSYHFLSIQVIY